MSTCDSVGHDPFSEGTIGSLRLRNRLIRAGCFEGLSFGGRVTNELIEHHREVAAGGIAMTTVAYTAVSRDGLGFDYELWMRDEILPDLERLVRAVHAEGAAASIQLGHCGFFSDPRVTGMRNIGASPKVCTYRMAKCREMAEDDMARVRDDFTAAARKAREVGFDAVEIHAGHGYLLSQFLSPWTNRRRDRYGGDIEHRLRFPVDVIRAVRESVGGAFPILVKMNQRDGFPGGLELEESLIVSKAFEGAGADALIPSCGFTSRTAFYMLRGRVPTAEMARAESNPIMSAATWLFGRISVQTYRHERMFLLPGALRIQERCSIPVICVGGVESRADMEEAMARGIGFFQIGRATIRDPEFPRKLASDEITESDCDHCNRCVAAMSDGGVYCVSRDAGLMTT